MRILQYLKKTYELHNSHKLLTDKEIQQFGDFHFDSYLCKRNRETTLNRESVDIGVSLQLLIYLFNMIKIISKERPTPIIGQKETELKYTLYVESSGTVSYKDVVKFACKHTGMQSTVMKAAIDSCCQTIEHFLSMGHRVQLGELGSFFITTDSNAVYSNTEAGICQLKKLNIRFDAKKDLKEAINNAERELAGVYKIVDHERKIYEKVGTKESDGKNESGNNSNGNSGGDSNNGNNSDSGGGFAG